MSRPLERSLYLKNIIPRQGKLMLNSGITLNGLLSIKVHMQCSKINTHSNKYVILLECLHDHPMSRVLTDSLTLAYAMYEKIIIFKTKPIVLENILPRFSKKMGLPSEANWLVSFPKQSWSSSKMIRWPISQPNSPEYHPVKFLSQPCPFLQKTMSCTHT